MTTKRTALSKMSTAAHNSASVLRAAATVATAGIIPQSLPDVIVKVIPITGATSFSQLGAFTSRSGVRAHWARSIEIREGLIYLFPPTILVVTGKRQREKGGIA
jgi:hypothetical protein